MRVTLWLDTRRSWADLLALAQRAEAARWDAVRVGGDGRPAAWAVVGALAVTVPRIRLEIVTRNDADGHPAVLTKLAATVDQLSNGRLLLGLMASAGGESRLAEAARVVKCLAGSDRTSWRGEFYGLHDAPLDPKPRQLPFPVMLVGTTPALAAASADHWSITGTPDEVGENVVALGRACEALGRDRHEIAVSAWGDATAAEYAAAGVDEWVTRDITTKEKTG